MLRHRWAQIIVSLLVTAAAYQLYAVLAVPLIEPEPNLHETSPRSVDFPADQRLQQRLEALSAFFPGRSQLIKNAKMLEIDQTTVLFQDYWNLGEGRVLVRPCLLVFDSRTSGSHKWPSNLPEILILEALDGAIFQFDRPLDLRTARIGRFIAGQLLGNVVVRGENPTVNNPDFRLTTRDITVTEHRVWTNHPLELSWGKHRARGAGMEIVFRGRTPFSRGGSQQEPLNVDRFLLRHVDRLHIDLETLRPPDKWQPTTSPDSLSPSSRDESLDISCQGPLLFVPAQKTITLEDRVEVARTRNGQTVLQLRCQQLVVTFQDKQAPNSTNDSPTVAQASRDPANAKKSVPGSSKWQVHLVRAVGQPVRIVFPTWNGELQGDDLRYDATSGAMSLDGSNGVHGKRGKDQFSARGVQCQLSPMGDIQMLAAVGPGKAEFTPTNSSQEWLLTWGRSLTLTNQSNERIAALQGGVHIEAASLGTLEAQEVWCWADAGPHAADFATLRVRRFVAESGVELRSSQFVAQTDRLEAWIKWEEASSAEAFRSSNVISAPPVEKTSGKDNDSAFPRNPGQIVLRANLLRMEFAAYAGQAAELTALSADGNVVADERPQQPDLHPLQLRGDHLEVTHPTRPTTIFSLTGNPAYVAGRGLALTGYQIFLDRGRNLLSVAGVGRLDIEKSAAGTVPVSIQDRVAIQWNQGMDFAGRTISFQGGVQLTSGPRRLQANALGIELEQPVILSSLSSFERHQVRLVRAIGNVFVENLELAPSGDLVARDMLRVSEISVDFLSGRISAPGPGRFGTVRQAASLAGIFQTGGTPPSVEQQPLDPGQQNNSQQNSSPDANPNHQTNSSPVTTPDQRLVMLDISFHQRLEGNIHQRQVGCYGRVKARYGGVATWSAESLPDDPALLGPEGMVLNCQELTAFQIVTPGEQRPHLELLALGNVTLEAQFHTARARRLSLDESKTLLVLEGDGDVPAELYRQEFRGGPVQKTTARRIYFWYSTKTVKVDDAKSLEISRSPAVPLGG
ncbi:hypothetical protein [Thermogutta sp.]|uniref:hypothetical protein n=1 Tax=Thermogutta sp. TaxID=1962930 RepID=UPI003C7ED363